MGTNSKIFTLAMGTLMIISGMSIIFTFGTEAAASSIQKNGIDYKISESANAGGGSNYINGITLSKSPDTEAWATYEFFFPISNIHQMTAGVYLYDDSWFGQGPSFEAFNWQTSSWNTIANPIGKQVGYYSYPLGPSTYISAPSPCLKIRIHAGFFDSTDVNFVRVDYSDDGLPSVSFGSPVGNGGSAVTTSSSITVSGSASDDYGLSAVEVQVNGGLWSAATGTFSWSKTVSLNPGSNTVYARAKDTINQYSSIQQIFVSYQPQTGTIYVNTNLADATFTLNGPASYSGSGTSWFKTDAPIGTYTITYGAVSGYTTPSSETITLDLGSAISFTGTYLLGDNQSEERIALLAGWNLVSIPLIQTDTTLPGALSSIAGQWDVVKYYDATDINDPWKSHRVGGTGNDLSALDRTMGFWLHTIAPCNLSVIGTNPATTSITLHAGWNFVGYPSQTERFVADALWGTGADRVEIADQSSSTLLKVADPFYIMKPGEGYLVHATSDCVWVVEW